MPFCLYLVRQRDGLKLSTTSKIEPLIRKIGRGSRRSRGADVLIAVVGNDARIKKLRRVLERHWRDQYRGGGTYTIGAAEAVQVVRHITDTYQFTCYGPDRPVGQSARYLALHRFARGRRAKWQPGVSADQAVLDELLAAGIITRHQLRNGTVEYRGTERASAIARRVADERVPGRGKPPVIVSNTPIIGEAVVPEPHMARELLIARMDEAIAAGSDPHDVLHRDAYRGAMVNLRDQLGGFASLELDEFQRRGVAKFRQTGEDGQLGGAKAIDYEVTRVDSSLVNTVTEAGALARAEYRSATDMLKATRPGEDEDDRRPGLVRAAVAERLAIQGQSLREVSIALGMGSGGAARDRTRAIAMGIATDLARHFGYLRGGRSPIRQEGHRPSAVPEAFRHEITPKRTKKREKA